MAERIASSLLFLLLLSLSMVPLHLANETVPAIFIFGDSTVDVGTNNHLSDTAAKADFPHYGIDSPGSKPTGRFSNGNNSADFIAISMGFAGGSPPPYLDLLNGMLSLNCSLKGINFASGGSGILNATGRLLGQLIPLSLGQQIQQFATLRENFTVMLGPEAMDSMLSKSLFIISVGSNDIFEYFTLNDVSRKQEFMDVLIPAYENNLRMLYTLGARKFGIISVAPIGCCPSQRLLNATGGCLEPMNDYSWTFYSKIEAMLGNLKLEFTGMKYSLGNTYEMGIDLMENKTGAPFKFKEQAKACCGDGNLNAEYKCSPNATVCPNRQEYLFWDRYHPSELATSLAAFALYGGKEPFVTPINFSQLASDDN